MCYLASKVKLKEVTGEKKISCLEYLESSELMEMAKARIPS